MRRTLQTTRERSNERSGGLTARREATAEAARSRSTPDVQDLPGTRSGCPEPGYLPQVRPNGRAGSAASRRPRGHVCCLYDDVGELRRHRADSIVAGLRAGRRVAYAGLGRPMELLASSRLQQAEEGSGT